MDRAACRGMDTAIFFPMPRGSEEEAAAICKTCSVQTECADHAGESPDLVGVWAGVRFRSPGEG